MKFIDIFFVLLLFLSSCKSLVNDKPTNIKHVFVIGVDAMSSQGLMKAETPNMDYLIKNGSICRNVRTVIPSSSSSNWASMLAGAGVEIHGVTSNDWEPDNFSVKPVAITEYGIFPTVINVVSKQLPNGKVGSIYNWSGFGRLFEKNVADLDISYPTEKEVADALSDYIRDEKPVFTFSQFDNVDHIGHEYGHMSEEYLKSISQVDEYIGQIMQSIKDAGIENESVIMVVADHGGIGRSHGGESWEEMTVPFILYGNGIKKGHEVSQPVYMYDVAPTVTFALGLDAPYAWRGKPIKGAFEGFEPGPDPISIKNLSYGPSINGGRKMFEQAGGLYIGRNAEVAIEPYNKSDEVYYTLDGSVPTKSSILYKVPFILDKTTVVKAKSFSSDGNESVVSEGYFRVLKDSNVQDYGVNVSFYKGNRWTCLPNFKYEKVLDSWNSHEINIDLKRTGKLLSEYSDSNFGLLYTSRIKIEKSGEYRFYLQSDDGSKLYINGNMVVNNDGGHGIKEKTGSIFLESGMHDLRVEFFNNGGGYWLDAFYEGPGVPKQLIPADKLYK